MFKINGETFVEPVLLEMYRTPNVSNSFSTQSGRTVADVRGWKYADTTLSWGTIPTASAASLFGMTEFQMTFEGVAGDETVTARIVSFGSQKQRFRIDGAAFFANFSVEVTFPDVYDN